MVSPGLMEVGNKNNAAKPTKNAKKPTPTTKKDKDGWKASGEGSIKAPHKENTIAEKAQDSKEQQKIPANSSRPYSSTQQANQLKGAGVAKNGLVRVDEEATRKQIQREWKSRPGKSDLLKRLDR
jgi:hypothetical protein